MAFWILLLVGLSLTAALPYKEQVQNLSADPEPSQEIDQDRYKRKLNDNGASQLDFRFRESFSEEQTGPDSVPKDDYRNNGVGVAYAMNNETKDDQGLEDNQPVDIENKKRNFQKFELTSGEDETSAVSESVGGMNDKQTKSTHIEYIGSMLNYNIYKTENGEYFGVDKEHILTLSPPTEIIYVSPKITGARRYTEKITKGASNKKDLVLKYSAGHVPTANSSDVNTERTGQYNASTTSTPMLENSEHLSDRKFHHLLNGGNIGNDGIHSNSNDRLASYYRGAIEKSHSNISTPEVIVDNFPNNHENVFKYIIHSYKGRHVRDTDGHNLPNTESANYGNGPPQIIHVPSRKAQRGNRGNLSHMRERIRYNAAGAASS